MSVLGLPGSRLVLQWLVARFEDFVLVIVNAVIPATSSSAVAQSLHDPVERALLLLRESWSSSLALSLCFGGCVIANTGESLS